MKCYISPISLFTLLCVLLLSYFEWFNAPASSEELQLPYTIDANGTDSTKGYFLLRIDMFGEDDKWDQISAPRVSATRIIAIARKTLSAMASNGSQFDVTEVELNRFDNSTYWYYVIKFQIPFSTQKWLIPVFFSGKPVES